jgi:streptogramin lyase
MTFRYRWACLFLVVVAVLDSKLSAQPFTFTTFAGTAGYGSQDGLASSARFNNLTSLALDTLSNIYVADFGNSTIRKITPGGVVSTLAGQTGVFSSTDGAGGYATFNYPASIAADPAGNLYVTDLVNNTIRKITPVGVVSTFAGSPGPGDYKDDTGTAARFNGPYGITIDAAGNLYVSEIQNQTIRKISPAAVVTTLAGQVSVSGTNDGTGSLAQFNSPSGLALDSATNVYVADYYNYTIRKVTPAGVVTTVAGQPGVDGYQDGGHNVAMFDQPAGVAVDPAGNIYVADYQNNVIREIAPSGQVSTPAGTPQVSGSLDGAGTVALFYNPNSVTLDKAGNLYVADNANNTIRKINPSRVVSTLAGRAAISSSTDGTGSAAGFNGPNSLVVDPSGNIYVADETGNTIRKITPAGVVTTLAGSDGLSGSTDATGAAARFNHPEGVAVDKSDNVYVADQSNNTIRKITPAGAVSTFAGLAGQSGTNDGTGNVARFNQPSDVAVDTAGNVFVTDYANNTIRKITPARVVSTYAGMAGQSGTNDGTGVSARFNSPYDLVVDGAGNVYVSDTASFTIRKITPGKVVSTLAGQAGMPGNADGTGAGAQFNYPNGLALDAATNLYVADAGNDTLRKVTPAGVVTTIGGLAGVAGSADGTGSAARFDSLYGVAVDASTNLYVADYNNNTIRKGIPTGSLQVTRLLAPKRSAGQFSFSLTGQSNLAVNIEASSNLTSWVTLGSCVLENGTNFFLGLAQLAPGQFYRCRVP